MSFSKSKVARFGDKDTLLQQNSATDIRTRSPLSQQSARSASAKSGIVSASFNDVKQNESDNKDSSTPMSLTEARVTIKESSKHNCLTRIGRPNLKRTSKPKSAKAHEPHTKDSHTTLGSSRSGPASSRIPSIFGDKPGSVTSSRASSFVGSSNKSQDFKKRSIEMQYNLKAKRLLGMKKELIEKQRPAIEIYRALLQLRIRFKEMEGKELPLDELKIVDCPEFRILDEKQREADEKQLRHIKKEFGEIPNTFLGLCRQILDEKCSILDKTFSDDDDQWSQDEFMKKIHAYKEQSTMLAGKIEGKLMEEEGKLRELIKEWYNIAKDHIGSGVSPLAYGTEIEAKLQDTEIKLKQALADLQLEKNKKNKEVFDRNRVLETELVKLRDKLVESQKNAEDERTKLLMHKERHTGLEHKLKQAKNKLKEAETVKQDLELQIDKLNGIIKKNDEEWESKEIIMENCQKELQQAILNHKEKLEELEKERHAVDVRMKEMQDEFKTKENEYLEKIQEQECEINKLKTEKTNLETEFNSLRIKSVSSDVFNHMQVMNKKKIESGDSAANKSAAEMALWKELKETQSALKLAEEKLAIYAEEKTRFLDTISENYQEDETTLNMTSQLIQKEELISTLILQNKQLQENIDENQIEFEQQQLKLKELEEKLQVLNEQLFATDVNTEKEIYEMHVKLQYEMEQNKELQDQLDKAQNEQLKVKDMILDYENLLKIRDGLLNMMHEKRQATEDQNSSLKDYIVQMREQLNLLGIDKSKKEQELKTLTMLLEEKTGYIDKIEERVFELESSVEELKTKRVNLQEKIFKADGELRVTKDKISRLQERNIGQPEPSAQAQSLALHETPSKEDLQEFISHAQRLCTQEALRSRKRLNRRHAQQNLSIIGMPSKHVIEHRHHSPVRPATANICTSERPTKIMTTVSDIIRRYKSSEGFDLKDFASSSDISI